MANLIDTIIKGTARVLGTVFAKKVQTDTLNAPTTSGGSTYGPGSTGNILKSNGTTLYWGEPDKATSAETADEATKANQDGDGNVIVDTYATKQESYASGVGVEITAIPGTSAEDTGTLWHRYLKDTDTACGYSYNPGDQLFIDPSVSILNINTSNAIQITHILPSGAVDFPNGKRITIIGNFHTGEGSGDYLIDPHGYSRLVVGNPYASGDGIVTIANSTNEAFSQGSHAHLYRQFYMEFIYWNKKWYSKGYDVTLATEIVTTTFNDGARLPVTSQAVYNYVSSNYLTTSGTAAKATADKDGNDITTTYLPLSGGTTTGKVTLGYSSSANGPYINKTTSGGSYLNFSTAGTILGSLGFQDATTPRLYLGSNEAHTILHDGNIDSYAMVYKLETDANNAVPPVTTSTGSVNSRTYIFATGASNVPNNSYIWNLLAFTYRHGNGPRCSQICSSSGGSSDVAPEIYIRKGSCGTAADATWTWGAWTKLSTAADLETYLPLAGGTMTGTINSQSVIAKTNDTYNVGSDSNKFKNIYLSTSANIGSCTQTYNSTTEALEFTFS